MTAAPHLPPQSCNVKTRYAMLSLPWLLIVIIIAALTSMAISLFVFVSFSPSFRVGDIVTRIERKDKSADEFDPALSNRVRQKIINIYDRRQKIDGIYYRDDAIFFPAALFSSDGWAVAYVSEEREGARAWEGINYQGEAFPVEKAIRDPVSSLLYIKFKGDGFPFMNFADWGDVKQAGAVWQKQGAEWKRLELDQEASLAGKQFEISRPLTYFTLSSGALAGALFLNDRGELAGIADGNRRLIPSWLPRLQYPFILEQGKTFFTGFPWRGYMVEGSVFITGEGTRKVNGFYVSVAQTRVTSSTIGIGDVITAIEKDSVSSDSLARQILEAPDPASITVFRNGKEAEVKVRKMVIY